MKAIRVHQYGNPDVLTLEEVTSGKPGPGEALVRLAVAGVNFIDIYQRRGIYAVPAPYIPGLEGAGTVMAVGEGVTTVKPGDRVAYTGHIGSYAQENIVPADRLIQVPSAFSFETAAAFPLQGMTAHYLLHEFYKVKKGDTVLIHAAAGGMGLLLVQWARHLGARVIGTVSTEEKAKAALAAGANDIILYTKQDFAAETKRLTNGQGADLIIDGVGKTTFAGNLTACRLRGHIVIYGAASGPADPISPNVLMTHSLTISGGNLFNFLLTRDELLHRANAVIEGIQQGWLQFSIGQTLPLKEAGTAHRLLENRETIGKVLLETT
ncbi:MAG: quinone oxidoreductase [Verrucomicrobia bacterium]|nr:quinone oxidoreductase [Verrucomicrobiota bacterium]